MIGFVSLHCMSINPLIDISILTVYMAHRATPIPIRRDFLYYCRTGYMVGNW